MADARWFGRWAPGGLVSPGDLDNGCQVDGYVSPPGVNQVAWIRESFRWYLEGYLEVQMHNQALLQEWKVQKSLSSQAS